MHVIKIHRFFYREYSLAKKKREKCFLLKKLIPLKLTIFAFKLSSQKPKRIR